MEVFFIKQELPINRQIKAKEVQLIGENGEKLGVVSFNEALEKMVNERLKGNPPKVATSAKTGLSKDDFRKMNMAQRIKLRNENLALYNELSK